MTVSTDGILCCGVAFDEDARFPWHKPDSKEGAEEEFEKWWAERCGIAEPAGEFTDARLIEFRAYWDAQRRAVEKCPVELVNYCSSDCPMYIVAARGSVRVARRGLPNSIDLTVTNYATKRFQDAVTGFCAEIGLPCESPSWLLCSYWG